MQFLPKSSLGTAMAKQIGGMKASQDYADGDADQI
jgi:hypothetical protein